MSFQHFLLKIAFCLSLINWEARNCKNEVKNLTFKFVVVRVDDLQPLLRHSPGRLVLVHAEDGLKNFHHLLLGLVPHCRTRVDACYVIGGRSAVRKEIRCERRHGHVVGVAFHRGLCGFFRNDVLKLQKQRKVYTALQHKYMKSTKLIFMYQEQNSQYFIFLRD
jgi:hypothetical protein